MLQKDKPQSGGGPSKAPRPTEPVDLTREGHGKWKLIDAFNFLRIKYAERTRYNVIALVIALAVTAGYWFSPVRPQLMGEQGILKDLKDFLQILFPFFVGALAAVATFSRPGLDEHTVGGQATLSHAGNVQILTRRQFVCYILGYCAVLSIGMFVVIILIKMLQPMSLGLGSLEYLQLAKAAIVFCFSLGFAHLVITTLWALYYLTNRLNR